MDILQLETTIVEQSLALDLNQLKTVKNQFWLRIMKEQFIDNILAKRGRRIIV